MTLNNISSVNIFSFNNLLYKLKKVIGEFKKTNLIFLLYINID